MSYIIEIHFIGKDVWLQGVSRYLALKSLPESFSFSKTGGMQITDIYDGLATVCGAVDN